LLTRAYALLTIKSVDEATRRISGVASTPTPDRAGDVLEPTGATFPAEIPLLLHHRKDTPVGVARLARTADAITFDAELPVVDAPGAVRDEVERAWTSIVHKLIRGVSIGFRPVGSKAVEILKSGGLRFLKTEILELSLVTIPANQDATLSIIKSLDVEHLAASGQSPPRVGGSVVVRALRDAPPMNKQTTAEQIAAFENTRAAKSARMIELMQKAADEHVTLDAAQTEEYDTLTKEVDSIDAHLVRLRALEKSQAATAQPVTTPTPPAQSAHPVITVKSALPAGSAFVRAACAMLVCKGNFAEAAEYAAHRWKDTTPEVALYLKAAVAAGNTTDATWAGPLVNTGIANDFLELLRPATILGKIPGLRRVPFNTKVPSQTAGGAYGWVGEAKPKPVTKLAFASDTLGIAKAAGIIVLTEELVRLSNPAAEGLARADMVAGIAQFLDQQFIDPAVAAVVGVNPASITNGAPTAAATTDPLADILGLINFFATNNIPVSGVTFILSEANALALSFRTNTDGSPQFPGIGIGGGSYKGINFVTSQAAGGNIIALQPSLILYADDGGVTIDASREASVQMDSAPMSPADATTVLVSLWQNNLVGLRAERFVNWKRANANAVKYLTAAAYPAKGAPPEEAAA